MLAWIPSMGFREFSNIIIRLSSSSLGHQQWQYELNSVCQKFIIDFSFLLFQTKSGVVRQAGDVPSYSLEVVGPLLPDTLSGLTTLFAHTQHAYTSVYSVHEPSTPFNAVPPEEQQEGNVMDSLTQSGINKQHLVNATKANQLGKQAIRELNYADTLYTWSS